MEVSEGECATMPTSLMQYSISRHSDVNIEKTASFLAASCQGIQFSSHDDDDRVDDVVRYAYIVLCSACHLCCCTKTALVCSFTFIHSLILTCASKHSNIMSHLNKLCS